MKKHTTEIRVRFCETDQMQFLHHARYIEYFEFARTEMLRFFGLPYSTIEKDGYQMPVISVSVNYKSPAYYDDLLEVEAVMGELEGPRVHIEYSVKNKNNGKLLAYGHSDLAFVNKKTNRPCKPPQEYKDIFNKEYAYAE